MKIKKTFFYTLVMVCLITKAFGQSPVSDTAKFPHSIWGSIGFGFTSLGAYSAMATFNTEVADHFVLSASASGESSSVVFSNTDVSTVNILAGRVFKEKHFLLCISAGVGFVNVGSLNTSDPGFFTDDGVKRTNRATIGVPILAQAYGVVLSGLAIGLGGYANLNALKTTGGLTISIAFGGMGTYRK